MKSVMKALEEEAAGSARRGRHLCGVFGITRERLLDQHMFAIGERGRAPLAVCRGRQGDIDEIDVVARDELCVRTECQRDRMLRGEVPGARQIA
jgi:hypothetical protein